MRLQTPPSGSGEGERTNYKIAQLKKFLRQHKLQNVAKLIQLAFNFELRNAFAHAEYRLTDKGIHLTKYNRLISYEFLQESFIAAYYCLQVVVSSIFQDRQLFANSTGYEEGGWKIAPEISERGMSVSITTDSPICRPTGFKRTGLTTEQVIAGDHGT